MPYCSHCGSEVEHVPEVAAVAESVSAEVQVAKINAEKEIALAKINARMDRDWNETRLDVAEVEAEAEVAAAEATAEVIGEIIAAEDETVTEDETGAEPVIIADVPEEEPDLSPPPVEGSGESSPKKPSGWSFG